MNFIFDFKSKSIFYNSLTRMDKLRDILKKSKPQTQTVFQKDVIAEQQKKFLLQQEEEKLKELQELQKKQKKLEQFYEYDIRRKKPKPNQESEVTIPNKQEVQARLRLLHQPITLFAEAELERYRRLQKIQEFYKNNPSFDMKNYDEQFQQKLKEQQFFNDLDSKYRDRLIEPKLGDDVLYIKKKTQMIAREGEKVPFQNMCDQIFLWIHKIIRDWGQATQQRYNTQQLREKYRDNINRYQQSANQIHSFYEVLKKRGGDKDMIRSIYHIMNCCLVREYILANDKYIDLSVGNAPWPMGVAMLSITVRRNAVKVSHVLDEQISRKWMQSIKRFITVSHELYPNHQQNSKKVGYSVKSTI